jgi:hypothetical protein
VWKDCDARLLLPDMCARFSDFSAWQIFDLYRLPDDPMIMKELSWWLENVHNKLDERTTWYAIYKGCPFNTILFCMKHEEKLSMLSIAVVIAHKQRKDMMYAIQNWDPKVLVLSGLRTDSVWMVEYGFNENLLDVFWDEVKTPNCLVWALEKKISQKHITTEERARFIARIGHKTHIKDHPEVYLALIRYAKEWFLNPLPLFLDEDWNKWVNSHL